MDQNVMSDEIDEDPPDDDVVIEPDRAPAPPSYPIPQPPNMGRVPATESTLEMGEIDPKVVVSTLIAQPQDIVSLLIKERDELTLRIAAIETLLGFVASSDDLSVRVAKLERFVGIAA